MDNAIPGFAISPDMMKRLLNHGERVDSSAIAIGAYGLNRLDQILGSSGDRYMAAGLTVACSLFREPRSAVDESDVGHLLHTIYHRPNGRDYASVAGLSQQGELQ